MQHLDWTRSTRTRRWTTQRPVCVESVRGNECTPSILVYVYLIIQGQREPSHNVSDTGVSVFLLGQSSYNILEKHVTDTIGDNKNRQHPALQCCSPRDHSSLCCLAICIFTTQRTWNFMSRLVIQVRIAKFWKWMDVEPHAFVLYARSVCIHPLKRVNPLPAQQNMLHCVRTRQINETEVSEVSHWCWSGCCWEPLTELSSFFSLSSTLRRGRIKTPKWR